MPASDSPPQSSRVISALAVYDALRRASQRSRAELAEEIGLSKPTVGAALQVLVNGRLIRERGHATGRRGPRALLYEPCHGDPILLAIDVGSTRVRGEVVDVDGRACATAEVAVGAPNAENVLAAVGELGDRLLSQPLEVAVVGSPGVVDPVSGKIRMCRMIAGWNDIRVEPELSKILGCDAFVENDVNLAAIGERDAGAGAGHDSFVYLNIGAGLGAGLVVGGRLHRGRHGAAGEISFLPCEAGAKFVANFAGADFAVERDWADGFQLRAMEQMISRHATHQLARSIDPDFDDDIDALLAGRHSNGELAEAVAETLSLPLAVVLAAITAVVDVETVLLGGDLGWRAKKLIEPTSRLLAGMVPYAPEIRLAKLGDRATLRGAAALGAKIARERMISRAIQEAT